MKQILLSFCLILSFFAKSQSIPTTYQDTVNYLSNEVVVKKSLFVGKPFSVLLDSLKINPVKLGIDWTPPADSLKGITAYLDFNYAIKFQEKHYLVIEWQNPLAWSVFSPVLNQGYTALKTLYAPIIIKDIELKDYSQPDPDDDLVY